MESVVTAVPSATTASPRRLNPFERYLSLWVVRCMAVGVLLGLAAPGSMQTLRSLEFGVGSQINAPIALLIWLMITPMMLKVVWASSPNSARRPRRLDQFNTPGFAFRPPHDPTDQRFPRQG